MSHVDDRLSRRASGVLMPAGCLWAPILGPAGERFVDWLAEARQSVWQMLPVHPPGAYGSPYDARSVFALDPGLLDVETIGLDNDDRPGAVEIAARIEADAGPGVASEVASFRHRHRDWLDDWALFASLCDELGPAWPDWPVEIATRDPMAIAHHRTLFSTRIEAEIVVQWHLRDRWNGLRRYAAARSVALFGDLPIYTPLHSADTWSHPHLFAIDRTGRPTARAGVPPDDFSEEGQLWGHPVYRWEAHADADFAWWIGRLEREIELFDLVRLDHFRGFESYWEVPAGAVSAAEGVWRPGPGRAFFDAARERLGPFPLVAEDLGVITDEVRQLAVDAELPGMRVLQFGFDGGDDNPHHPDRLVENAVVYTGTHDNPPSRAWYRALGRRRRARVRRAIGASGRMIHRSLVQAALGSPARLAMVPIADVLGLGPEGTINVPGTPAGNWSWTLDQTRLTPALADWLARETIRSGREPALSPEAGEAS